MIPTGSAVVIVFQDPPLTRAAALVYRTPKGMGWVEPGYFDDDPPPAPQWHTFDGPLQDTTNGVLLEGQQRILAMDIDSARSDYPEVARELDALAARLKARGTSILEQRITLAPELGASG